MRTRENIWAQERRVESRKNALREAEDILRVRMEDYMQERGWRRLRVQTGPRWHSSTTEWIPPHSKGSRYTLRGAWAAQVEREKRAARRAKAVGCDRRGARGRFTKGA